MRSICGNGSKIRNFNAEEEPAEDLDAYQEFMDYYIGKRAGEHRSDCAARWRKMSIVRRCTWLAEYIDSRGWGSTWAVMADYGDIKDIAGFLERLDDRYFTVDTIPVVDMERPEYRELFDELFERMEQYRPDDAGILRSVFFHTSLRDSAPGNTSMPRSLAGWRTI